MIPKLLSYKIDDFNLRDFSLDFNNHIVSNKFEFKVGSTYYLSITDCNGNTLGSIPQIPFILVNDNSINQLISDLYSVISLTIASNDWILKKYFTNSFYLNEIGPYELFYIYISSIKYIST